ncbi:MAG TPA: HU family DNA-binding protein [Niabella sp.]|nr:HU family DNA-binding protein [Niabella sp.]
MFELLTRYLLEYKKLPVPQVGIFELEKREAGTNLSAETIMAPVWQVKFIADNDLFNAVSDGLYNWLSVNKGVTKEEAGRLFEAFANNLKERLVNGEKVVWEGLGTLQEVDGAVQFTPAAAPFSPFTDVAAKKIIRENTSHATLVGDKETTTARMREQLLLPDQRKRKGTTVMWVLLAAALVAVAWYFSQNGCNTSATGNRQKVERTKPGDTYKIR